ncbi:MAG: 3-dehydroquinate synthase family protein [Sphingomicrobium sp.]
MTTITVAHGQTCYDIIVGDLSSTLPEIDRLSRGRLLPLVSDKTVFGLHGAKLGDVAMLPPILVPSGEAAKDWDGLRQLVTALTERGVQRGTPIIALGGGSVGDLTGLAAALYMRGSPVIHVPTTLLAQADSAVGGKTAIDSNGVKNLVGLFHPPALVVVDPSLIDTLDRRQCIAGYAEIAKYGLIDDPEFFLWCERHGAAVVNGEADARKHAIAYCLNAKARFVTADPEEGTGVRALLNLGHSFGHAIESAAGLGGLLHGEAVAIGMATAFRLAAMLRLCTDDDAERVSAHLASVGLPTRIADTGVDRRTLIDWMALDKKNAEGRLTLVLVRGIGRAFVDRSVARDVLASFLARAA